MKYFTLRLMPEQALQIDDPGMIAGRAVRGMIAAAALRTCSPGATHDQGACSPSCLYWPLFNPKSGLRVGHAYATSADDSHPYHQTAYTCSVAPGFRTYGQHGVLDTAIRQWIADENPLSFAPFEFRCPVCNAPLIPPDGRFMRVADRQYAAVEIAVQTVETAHRSFNPARGQGRESLFTQRGITLGKGSYYASRVIIPDTLETPLRTALFRDLVVGGRRTRGMGAVQAELIAKADPTATLRGRVAEFNKAVRAERRYYGAMSNNELVDDGTWYFTVDFPEGAILDAAQVNTPLAGLKALRGVQALRTWLDATPGAGRNVAAGLRSRSMLAIRGVAIYSVPPEEDRVQLEGALAYLEAHGIGLERDRGYGNVTICDPLHLETEPY